MNLQHCIKKGLHFQSMSKFLNFCLKLSVMTKKGLNFQLVFKFLDFPPNSEVEANIKRKVIAPKLYRISGNLIAPCRATPSVANHWFRI